MDLTKATWSERLEQVLSLEYLKSQVLQNAYGNSDAYIAKRDPRGLLVWYLFFGLAPWFIHNPVVLVALFVFVLATAALARMAPLVLFLFALGVFSQTGYLLLTTLIFGGNHTAIIPLLILTLKVCTVSLASITVFSGLDPDRLSLGLMYFRFPEQLSFSIGYAYRLLPLMVDSFQHIHHAHRMRGATVDKTRLGWQLRWLVVSIKRLILCFYPLMLNMAKRSRTTVEALEIKGYQFGTGSKSIRAFKLQAVKTNGGDWIFMAVTLAWIGASIYLARLI